MPQAPLAPGEEALSHEEILRYSRHLLMPEVGLAGQRRLKASSVLVIGTGGLGSPVALYLAAAGVGRLGLVDCDRVETVNLHRQVIHSMSTVGQLKVDSARARLLDLNPGIRVETHAESFTSENALRVSEPYDLILDCSDNFPTRYLVNDVCVLTHKPDVYGSVFRFEGQVSVFWADRGPCYRCLFPDPPPPGLVPSCAEAGVFGVLPGTIGTLQATEALKLLLGIGEPLIGKLLVIDALSGSFEELRLKKNPRCRICSETPEVRELVDYAAFCGAPGDEQEGGPATREWEVEPAALAAELRAGKPVQLIDVREPHELEISRLSGAQLIPLGSLASRLHELDRAQETVVFCRSGTRSERALALLAGAGFRKVRHLHGGINGWAREVDPSLPVY
jgi:molybdopterin/thiamine biosynthesis adenylyltransferase/rhodanese-related sulfurtransferase